VLRGLTALVRWAELGGGSIPLHAITGVVDHLVTAFPDGVIRRQRHAVAVCPSGWRQTPEGEWKRQPTTGFPLLDALGTLGTPSAALTRQWSTTRRSLLQLLDAGRIVDG
jgi:hypothetical protein